jgi:hypothetical protein
VRFLLGFARFWYEFIVGDDWRIAAEVVLILALGAGLVEADVVRGEWLAPILAAAILVIVFGRLVGGTLVKRR